ncbi:transcription factor domain-containing protein [Lipomyces japonicus]|uniref:transcription factor domain-containing protein n=1 Tax=Lipomyces japonicus TaxID=56871 RepID=UPI0034CD4E2B
MTPHEAPTTSERYGLPPVEIQVQLVRLYFENINSWFPIIDAESLWTKLFGPSMSEPNILMYAIVAAASRFLPATVMTRAKRDYYHISAAQKIMLLSFEMPTLDSLEAMIIMAVDVVGTSNGPKCWAIMSMICSISLRLGINRNSSSIFGTLTPSASSSISAKSISTTGVPIIDPIDFAIEERKRMLFWGAYVLDRF